MDRRSFVTTALPAAVIFVLTASAANALTMAAPPGDAGTKDNNIQHVWWRRRWGWHRRWGWRRW